MMAAAGQDRIFLLAFLHTGGRRSEILRLTWADDINFDEEWIRLGSRKNRHRTMKYRYIGMSRQLKEQLQKWYRKRPFKASPYVFVDDNPHSTNYGNRYTQRRKFMKGLCKRAGITEFGFHALRRFRASLMADDKDTSLETIRRFLGHHAVSTTDRYIHRIKHGAMKEAVGEVTFLEKNTPRQYPPKKKGSTDSG